MLASEVRVSAKVRPSMRTFHIRKLVNAFVPNAVPRRRLGSHARGRLFHAECIE